MDHYLGALCQNVLDELAVVKFLVLQLNARQFLVTPSHHTLNANLYTTSWHKQERREQITHVRGEVHSKEINIKVCMEPLDSELRTLNVHTDVGFLLNSISAHVTGGRAIVCWVT